MSITFNADEIFAMAIEIEQNGAKFYRKAAENAESAVIKEMLTDMATMEDGHEAGFKAMREELTDADKEQITFDPQGEAELYLQEMADSHGTEGKKSLDMELTGKESIREILETAINAEKDSIVFYISMKKLVPSQAGKDKVDDIIAEEIGHVTLLGSQLAQLG